MDHAGNDNERTNKSSAVGYIARVDPVSGRVLWETLTPDIPRDLTPLPGTSSRQQVS